MATPDFHYQDPFPLEKDDTQYRLITSNYVSVGEFEGHPMLKVEPEGLRLLAAEAFHDVAFFLRPAHLKQVAAILDDPEASANDKSVALTMLRNAEVAAAGILPFCQDTGTRHHRRQEGPAGLDRLRRLPNFFPTACTTPTPRTTCATPKPWRWTCTRRRTPEPTCPPR